MNLRFEERAQPRHACHNRPFRSVDFPNGSIYVHNNNNWLMARYRRFYHAFGRHFHSLRPTEKWKSFSHYFNKCPRRHYKNGQDTWQYECQE